MKKKQSAYVIARARFDTDGGMQTPRSREDFEKRQAPNMRDNMDQAYDLYVKMFNALKR